MMSWCLNSQAVMKVSQMDQIQIHQMGSNGHFLTKPSQMANGVLVLERTSFIQGKWVKFKNEKTKLV